VWLWAILRLLSQRTISFQITLVPRHPASPRLSSLGTHGRRRWPDWAAVDRSHSFFIFSFKSDNDFAPKKGNKKGGMDNNTKSSNTNKKSVAFMAKTQASSQRIHQVKSVNPRLLCACSLLVVHITHLSCCPRQSRHSQGHFSIYVHTYLH